MLTTLQRSVYNSKKEVIERLKDIVASDETPDKAEVDHLKTTFYKLHFTERDKKQKEYLEAGGDPEKYQITPDEDEEVFKAEMSVIKEKRQKAFLALEEEKQKNLKRKEEILEKIKQMSATPKRPTSRTTTSRPCSRSGKRLKTFPPRRLTSCGTTISCTSSSSTTC